MIVSINPPLEGSISERFLAVAQSLARSRKRNRPNDLRALLQEELKWVENFLGDTESNVTYEASVRVLLDLVRLGWEVSEEGYGIELISNRRRTKGLTPEEIKAEKQKTRELFLPTVQAQLNDKAVRKFAQRMENPSSKSGKTPITALIANGGEIHARLSIAAKENQDSEDPYSDAIKPYLQLAQVDKFDEFTGHSLRDIWRYFRYTWSIPQFSTPGRQLLYIVRDAAHPCHAVMGIIGLNNCAMQMGEEREYFLGWNLMALTERLIRIAKESPKKLKDEFTWIEDQITSALSDVEHTGLVSNSELDDPTLNTVSHLRRKSQEFDRLRDEALRELAIYRSGDASDATVREIELYEHEHPPVDNELLLLEKKRSVNPAMQKARRHLVVKKRSALLAQLLHARLVIKKHKKAFCDPKQIVAILEREEIGIALQTVLAALKSRYAGINMLEISTCGAIPPYQYLLGGKLSGLLLLSPEVAADYQKIYINPSIISSQIKNAPVVRDNKLVYLGTTSLYAQGSSQYERLKLPPGIISKEQPELRYRRVGKTSGFGTLQFLDETREAVDKFLNQRFSFQNVNSIFGEGPSPKLRKLATGLRELGFPPDMLMRHNHQRLIYAVELSSNARDFLNSHLSDLPEYIESPELYLDATERIAQFWRQRWLKIRLRHTPSMNALISSQEWKLSDRFQTDYEPVTIPQSSSESANDNQQQNNGNGGNESGLKFWMKLAAAGPKVATEALTTDELSRIHIETPVLNFIKEQVENGISVFLTGNAGDGKTHILRHLAPSLHDLGTIVIEDATAVMRREEIAPVLDEWRNALAKNVPFCIAINEYPLYLLRQRMHDEYPELASELDRQCRERLAYGPIQDSEESKHSLLVIDLSLRNPLHIGFADLMIDKIISDLSIYHEEVSDHPYVRRNLERLKESQVKDRLLCLFQRLADTGHRSTIRELWITLSRIFLGYRADLSNSQAEGTSRWYSEVLFTVDERFGLSRSLQKTDPAYFSHPIWDISIEQRRETAEFGWKFGTPQAGLAVHPNRKTFNILKRAFYFEHENGEACFELEHPDIETFRRLVRSHRDNDSLAVGQILEAINRAYCPVSFPGSSDSLLLWVGHRFQEQPSRSFLANRRIPASNFNLYRPRIPTRAAGAMPKYRPDHLLLRYNNSGDVQAELRLDFNLYQTLQRLRRGLSRKLLPPRDSFRLESFLESLHRTSIAEQRLIYSAHLERRELAEIELTADKKKYARINKHN